MSLADPLTANYNAVAKSANYVDEVENGPGRVYYLDDSANNMRFTITVKHIVPKTGEFPEQHMIKSQVDHIDPTSGLITHTNVNWTVMRADVAPQDLVKAQRALAYHVALLSTTNTDKILTRQS